MSKYEQLFIKELSNQEIIAHHKLARDKKIKKNEIESCFFEIQKLTITNNFSNKINFDTLNVLGLKNSAIFFYEICRKYKEFLENSSDFSFESEEKIVINKDYVNFNTNNFINKLNNLIMEDFNNYKNSGLNYNKDDVIFKIALANAFAEIYYPIKDFNEGKTYNDTELTHKYRKLPNEYLGLSNILKRNETERECYLEENKLKNQIDKFLVKGVKCLSEITYCGSTYSLKPKNEK